MGTRQLVVQPWAAPALLLLLALALLAAGASDLEAIPPSPWNLELEASLPRKLMKGTTAAPASFCGSAAGSYCSVEDEQKLLEKFRAEEAHGYHDAECRSELKAYYCAKCLRPSNTSTTTMNSSLPLPCAGTATVTLNRIVSTAQAQAPAPEPQLRRPRNISNALKKLLEKWLIPLIGGLLMVIGGGGYVAYRIYNNQNFECCNNNQILCCCLCCYWRRRRAPVGNRGSELVRAAELVGPAGVNNRV